MNYTRTSANAHWHWLALIGISTVVLALYGPLTQPIFGDRAYFIYMAQAVARGDLLYDTTTYGYTPYGPLLSAASIFMGNLVDLPSYFSPRLFGMLVWIITPCLLYEVVRKATRSPYMALLAGVCLSGFGYPAMYATVNLEPKALVIVFTLLSQMSVQRRAWFWTGVWAAAAAMSWQPAIVVPIAMGVLALLSSNKLEWGAFLKLSAGVLAGILPAVIYLSVTHQWESFYLLAVSRKLITNLEMSTTLPWRWLFVVPRGFYSDVLVVLFGFGGLLWHGWSLLKHGVGRFFSSVTNPQEGGFWLLAGFWALFNAIEFDQMIDAFPLLPAIAFWCSRLLWFGRKPVCRMFLRISEVKPFHWCGSLWIKRSPLILLGVLLYWDAVIYRPPYTLKEQIGFVKNIPYLEENLSSFIAFNLEEVYVLTEHRAEITYTRLAAWTNVIMELRNPDGFTAVLEEIKQINPNLVFIAGGKNEAKLRRLKDKEMLGRLEDEALNDYIASESYFRSEFYYHIITLESMIENGRKKPVMIFRRKNH